MQPVWHAMIGVALIAAFFAVAGLVVYLLYGPGITIVIPDFFGLNKATTTQNAVVVDPLAEYGGTRFGCDGERALKAEFLESSVRLVLSDGRVISLPQTVSASGARYANTDESFVFQTRDYGAFIEESGVMTYANCAVSVPN